MAHVLPLQKVPPAKCCHTGGVQPPLPIPTTADVTAQESSRKGMWFLSKESLFEGCWEAHTVVLSKPVEPVALLPRSPTEKAAGLSLLERYTNSRHRDKIYNQFPQTSKPYPLLCPVPISYNPFIGFLRLGRASRTSLTTESRQEDICYPAHLSRVHQGGG